jgi:hypothetical protein
LETTAAHRELLRSRCVAQAAIRQQIVAARWISAAAGIHVLVLTVMSLRICRGTWWCRSRRTVAAHGRGARSRRTVAAHGRGARSRRTVAAHGRGGAVHIGPSRCRRLSSPTVARRPLPPTGAVRPLQTDRLPDHCQPTIANRPLPTIIAR